MNRLLQHFYLPLLMSLAGCNVHLELNNSQPNHDLQFFLKMDEKEWRNKLTPMQFYVLREKGTERPFTGIYDDHFEEGWYHCAGCNARLFRSNAKFNSGCGWPSFFEPATSNAITYQKDTAFGMVRNETLCSNCGGHLGHVFEDGPDPTGLRYCINSAAIVFIPVEIEDENSLTHPPAE